MGGYWGIGVLGGDNIILNFAEYWFAELLALGVTIARSCTSSGAKAPEFMAINCSGPEGNVWVLPMQIRLQIALTPNSSEQT